MSQHLVYQEPAYLLKYARLADADLMDQLGLTKEECHELRFAYEFYSSGHGIMLMDDQEDRYQSALEKIGQYDARKAAKELLE